MSTNSSPTISNWLGQAQVRLEEAGVTTARLDCLVLLEDVVVKERTHLLAHPELELTPEQETELNEQIAQRMLHIPLAYIRGKTEFYGRAFMVNHHVLEPRPESETMIDLLLSLQPASGSVIADIGTGSGALAITAKLELPHTKVFAVDIDPECIKVAEQNAERLQTEVTFLTSNLYEALIPEISEPPFALLCNLPYVPDNFQINPAAMNEPRLAIFGGEDGLELYRTLISQLEAVHRKPAFILTEALPLQHFELIEIMQKAGYYLEKSEDFIQVFASRRT